MSYTPGEQPEYAQQVSASSPSGGSAGSSLVAPLWVIAGFLLVTVVLLFSAAGSLNKQACIDSAVAKYGYRIDDKSLANLARKGSAMRCSSSPF